MGLDMNQLIVINTYPETVERNITLIPAEIDSISILSPFSLFLIQDISDYANQNEPNNLTIKIEIPKYTTPGTYFSKIIFSKKEPEYKNITFTVQEYNSSCNCTQNVSKTKEVEISSNKIEIARIKINVKSLFNINITTPENLSFTTGERGVIYLSVRNEGNMIMNLSLSTLNTSFQIPKKWKDIFLLPGFEYEVPISYSIAENESFGEKIGKVKIGDRDVEIKYVVVDKRPPEVTINTTKAGYKESFEVCYNIYDESGIADAIISFQGNKKELSRDKGCIDFAVDKYEEYSNLQVVVKDKAGNEKVINKDVKIEKIKGLQYDKKVYAYQTKVGKEAKVKLFRTPMKVKVKVKLTDFDFGKNNLTDLKVKIKTDKGTESFGFNEEKEFEVDSEMSLLLYSEREGEYKGKVELIFPEWIDVPSPLSIDINGKFGDYSVQGNYSGEIWNRTFECFSDDTGHYESSKLRCCIEYPIDTHITDINIPITKREELALKESCNSKLEVKDKVIEDLGWWRIGLLFVCFVLFMVIIYLKYIKGEFAIAW